ncbi:L-2-amino-thiazoline-4-carboxylic acid hydrolase [Bacillus sp. J33]|uniref:L-2-amino-thiazoline-4-carboxylic acid hydrolase n=1 Tax=Bacillus sp. J33 TaxID=935836 RepID=UPI00047E2E97|nr:L-2-amino-thiazoline-4-carboxylic acid hydrolase [Bacillus sp. J33]
MSNTKITIPPLSMYAITAKLFTHVERSVLLEFGEEGKTLLQKGVANFGYKDAEEIAIQATVDGENHTLFNYIPKDYQDGKNYQDITIYALMAKLFAQVSKVVVDRFGEIGKDAVREGVRTFGEERGRGIAQRARSNGEENTRENYLTNYDMGRSELFTYTTEYKKDLIEQNFTGCPFGQQWADDDMHEYGILYCQIIDPAVAKGYNPKFEVEHDKYILKEGNCHFQFKLADEKAND